MTSPTKSCAVCGAPATKFCSDCIGTYGDDKNMCFPFHERLYCSTECQRLDKNRPEHRCEEMANLVLMYQARCAGAAVSAIFLAFMKNTWSTEFGQPKFYLEERPEGAPPEFTPEIRHIYVPIMKERSDVRPAGGWFAEFDNSKFQAFPGWEKVLLSDRQSKWAFVVAFHAVKHMFSPLCNDVFNDIKEVTHSLKPGIRRYCTYMDPGSKFFNLNSNDFAMRRDLVYNDEYDDGIGVFEIRLKNGRIIALDLCGQQFYGATYRPVQPWAAYWNKFGSIIETRPPLGTRYRHHCEILGDSKTFSHLFISTSMITHLNRWLDQVGNEEKGDFNPLTVLLNLRSYKEYWHQVHCLYMRTRSFLSMLVQRITIGETPLEFDLPASGLRHPLHAGLYYTPDGRLVRMTALSHVSEFGWDQFKEVASAKEIPYATRKDALEILTYKAVYMPPGELRLVFYKDEYPPKYFSRERVNENPYWRPSRTG